MNNADIAVLVILAALVGAAVFVMLRNRKKGKNSCGGDCLNCSGCGSGFRKKK